MENTLNIDNIKIGYITLPFADLCMTANNHKYYMYISSENKFKDNEV